MLKRLIEARWVQSLVSRYDLKLMERLLLARHDFTARDKLQRVFRRGTDPYHYATSPYELARFERMTGLLAGRRFRNARGLRVQRFGRLRQPLGAAISGDRLSRAADAAVG